MQSKIGDVYAGLDTTLETFPSDDTQHDDGAVLRALDTLSPADVAIIFTPDDTHHQLATACVRRGLHTLVAKPLVKSLDHHRDLAQEATRAGVLLATGEMWAEDVMI